MIVQTLGPDGIILAILGAIVTAGTAWKLVLVPFVRSLRKLGHFLDDWAGEPPRPGTPGRPGFPERLAVVEDVVADIKKEVKPNTGSSLRDAVDRVESSLTEAVERVGNELKDHVIEATDDRASLHTKVDEVAAQINEHLRRTERHHHDHHEGGASE